MFLHNDNAEGLNQRAHLPMERGKRVFQSVIIFFLKNPKSKLFFNHQSILEKYFNIGKGYPFF